MVKLLLSKGKEIQPSKGSFSSATRVFHQAMGCHLTQWIRENLPVSICDAQFENERELQDWAFANSHTFFGESILLGGFKIATPSGKAGLPDGFVFNFGQRSWWVVECELLAHGVWPHIAEQVTRFVVAARNPTTLRQVRDKLFDRILETGKQEYVMAALGSSSERLLQHVELFIESVTPSLTIFIDDTNQDLLDCCDALDISSEIYRVKKFLVNGKSEYYSPDRNLPVASFDVEETVKGGSSVYDVIEQLGGGEALSGKNRVYRLNDGTVVKMQFSKLHERHQAYWYGVNPASYGQSKALGSTQFVFVMGDEGYVVLPISLVDSYLKTAYVTNNADGTVRHYHVHISPPPDVELRGYNNAPDVDVSDTFRTLG
jgi:hypothetical protein